MRAGKLFVIIQFVISLSAFTQQNLSVALDHPVYYFINLAEMKGALSNISRAKPYSLSVVIKYLETASANRERLDTHEIALLEDFLKEFKTEKSGLEYGNLSSQGSLGLFMGGISFQSDYRINFNDLPAFHMFNGLRLYMKGDIGGFLSYYGCFGVTYDKVGPESFPPYSYSKQWDGFHLGFGDPRYSLDGVETSPYFSFILENELTAQFFNDDLTMRFARLRRDWGEGVGNLYLAGNARPFEALEVHARLAPGVNLAYGIGSLANWIKERELKSGGDLTFQKMLTVQMLEFFPCDWLYLSVVSIAVWGKRFEIGYLNPLMYPVIHQNLHGDFDNVAQVVNCTVTIAGIGQGYVSLFVDEMELANFKELFTRPRNMFAFQVGTKIPIPGLPATLLTLQYTRLEPFVYAHYPEEYLPTMSANVDLSLTHDNENLGSYLAPNSDEFLFKMETLLLKNLFLAVKYQLIRHGTNDYTVKGDLAIYGDVTIPFVYDLANLYPDKNFLFDGIYDWNNIITLEASYTLPNFPLTITLIYSFCYTVWVRNESGVTPPADSIKNIIALKVKIF